MKKLLASVLLAGCLTAPISADSSDDLASFRQVIAQTAAMVGDQTARDLAGAHGLQILNVTWEDTGRYKGSSVGPNISDMTLQTQLRDPKTDELSLTCLPVIRYDNFSDKTADVDLNDFFLLVGNENGDDTHRVSLYDYLDSPRKFMTNPDSWSGKQKSLLADRDSHALVSAQACFLPIPKGGEVTFNPVLFNYQSVQGDPAVLTILATREGTSMTIIDNQRDGFQAGSTWGQRLFFNKNGERASLTGTRMSDYVEQQKVADPGTRLEAAGEDGLNMVLLIQVPLKQRNPMRFPAGEMYCCDDGVVVNSAQRSTVENAVIGHGEVEGRFTEVDGLEIERDDRFPVRVTVQFYKATDNGVVSKEDISDIARQIERVYEGGDYVGSLVTGGETDRPTEYDGSKVQPAGWWSEFYKRHQQNTGQSQWDVWELFNRLGLVAR
ncbi:MAG: hypothetical protein KC800_08645 [Candidatus Eremiobacteraeota bacterium]|nr:hypothetical protein [Candidatus Eremiobacteraeota bacterium]